MINWQPVNLEDSLVKIIPLTENDFDVIFQVASDPMIWELHPTKDRYKKEVFQLFFDGAVASKTAFLIVDKLSNQVIGSTRFYDDKPENSSIAIGYTFLAKSCWGGKYNYAVKKLLLDYAFQFVDKVYFHVGDTNYRSQMAVLKLGAKKVREMEADGSFLKSPHFEYVLEKEIWLQKQL